MMAEGMGSSFLQFVQPLLTMAIPLLKSQNLSTIRNAIYCIRNMIEIGGSSIMLYIPQVFADISNIFSNPQNLTAHFVPENACAAFAAMVNVNPPGLPLPPVRFLLFFYIHLNRYYYLYFSYFHLIVIIYIIFFIYCFNFFIKLILLF